MRVLHVAESIKGGCGTYLNELLPVQSREWGEGAVRVIAPNEHIGQLPAVAASQIVTFARKDRSIAAFRALAVAIRGEVRSFQPDVVHLHSTFAGLIGRVLLRLSSARPRIVYCAHGWAFDMARSRLNLTVVAALERAMGPLADRIVAISDYERRRGLDVGIAPHRIATVLNGLADVAPPPKARPSDRLRLLFIGRLDAQKGWDILVDAVEHLGDQVTLRLVGASVVGDTAATRQLPPHIEALGWRTQGEIAQELAMCDLVVVPSRWEGFGLVALEAMRAGRAVLASRVGGLPEVVDDGATGRLVAPCDIVALREAILTFDLPTLEKLGSSGRQRFQDRFTIDRTATCLKRIYEEVVGEGPRRS